MKLTEEQAVSDQLALNEENMKYVLALMVLMLAGCSSAPRKVLMKNCDAVGSGLYECEEIPKKELGGKR